MHSSVRDQVTTAEVRGEMAEAHKCYSKMAKVTKEEGGVASTNVGCTSWITLAITSVKVPRGTINWKILREMGIPDHLICLEADPKFPV